MPSPVIPLALLSAALAGASAAGGPVGAEGRVVVTFDPPAPVKGRDAAVRVLLELRDATGAPLASPSPPRVSASCGRLGPIGPSGVPGRWEVRWEPSAAPQPEVLAVVAVAQRCPLCASPQAVGTGLLPVSAAIQLPGESDPGVSTTVEIAGRSWGPVKADGAGHFVLPAVVPPGARWGTATSRSSLGNLKTTRIDLQLGDQPGLLCALWPERLPSAGGEAGVACVAWTAGGAPLDPGSLRASVSRGELSRAGDGAAPWRARWRSPGGATDARFTAELAQARAARQELALGFASGPPASIEWLPEGEPALPGSILTVRARALDGAGRVLGEALSSDGRLEAGRLRVRTEYGDGRQRLTLRYRSPPGDVAATLSLHRVGGEWVAAVRDVASRPMAGVALRFRTGVTRTTDGRGEARVPAEVEAETVEGPEGLAASAAAGATAPPPAIEIEREVELALRPPGSWDVAARLDGKWLRWRVLSPSGEAAGARRVGLDSNGVKLGPPEADGEGGRAAILGGKGTIAVTDEESGATAIVEVQ